MVDTNRETNENRSSGSKGVGTKKIAIIVAVFLLLGGSGFFAMEAGVFSAQDDQPSQNAEEVKPLVDVKEVNKRDLEKVVTISGNVEPSDQRVVIPQMGGEVDQIYVEEGDDVADGEILMVLDDQDTRLQAQEARAGLKAARANLEEARAGARDSELTEAESGVRTARENKQQAEKDYERTKELHEEGFVTDQQLEQAEMQLENAKAQLDSAEAAKEAVEDGAKEEQIKALEAQVEQAETAVEMADTAVDNSRIEAPTSGRVVSVEVSEGELAGSGSPAFIILDRDSLQITASLPATYVNNATPGQEVEVKVPAVSDEIYNREIQRIGDLPPEGSRSYPMEVNLSNPEDKFRPGMHAEISLIVEERENVVSVPRYALVERDDEMGVYTVSDDETIEFTTLEVGLSEDGVMEVKHGLSGEELIVTGGHAEVLPGDEVRINQKDELAEDSEQSENNDQVDESDKAEDSSDDNDRAEENSNEQEKAEDQDEADEKANDDGGDS